MPHTPAPQGDGETRFPHAPARGRVRTQPSSRQMGKPGFPIPSPRRRVWEGYALMQGNGETRFPHSPTRGRVWEGYALPRTILCSFPFVCGGAAWKAEAGCMLK